MSKVFGQYKLSRAALTFLNSSLSLPSSGLYLIPSFSFMLGSTLETQQQFFVHLLEITEATGQPVSLFPLPPSVTTII